MKYFQIVIVFLLVTSISKAQEKKEIKVLNTKDDYYQTEWTKQESHNTKHLLNTQAPDFNLRTIKGDSIQLSELQGKVVFMTTFFIACGGCLHEIPFINKLAEYYTKKEVVFIVISPFDTPNGFKYIQEKLEGRGRVGKFHDNVKLIPASYLGKMEDGYYKGMEMKHISKEYKNVTKSLIQKKYASTIAPMAYFIDKKGVIRFIGHGYEVTKYDYYPLYTNEIDKLLAEEYKK